MLSLIYCPLLKGNKPNPSTRTAEITKAPGRDVVLNSVRFSGPEKITVSHICFIIVLYLMFNV